MSTRQRTPEAMLDTYRRLQTRLHAETTPPREGDGAWVEALKWGE